MFFTLEDWDTDLKHPFASLEDQCSMVANQRGKESHVRDYPIPPQIFQGNRASNQLSLGHPHCAPGQKLAEKQTKAKLAKDLSEGWYTE